MPELEEYFLVNLTSVELIMAPVTSFPPRLGMIGFCFHSFEIRELNLLITLFDICKSRPYMSI